MIRARQGVLVFLNGGLGNLIIAAPVLAAMERARPDLLCHLPANSLLGEPWLAEELALECASAVQYPPLWRRCAPDDMPALLDFVRRHHIEMLLNFRCEWIADDGNYLAFREQARAVGIECLDFHQLTADQQVSPIALQMMSVLSAANIALSPPDWIWLRKLRAPRGNGTIGCYVGASVGVKRWPPRLWIDAIGRLERAGWNELEVGAGPSAVEDRIASEVVHAADRARQVSFGAVAHLVTWIASLDVLVSNDTLSVHLAAALGTPVVGLYLATDGRIWSPVNETGTFHALQSGIALRCRAMKPDGTCRRFYRGCPAPCRSGVTAEDVVAAVAAVA